MQMIKPGCAHHPRKSGKIRSAIAATALTTAALVAGATSADAATTIDRHIDTHA